MLPLSDPGITTTKQYTIIYLSVGSLLWRGLGDLLLALLLFLLVVSVGVLSELGNLLLQVLTDVLAQLLTQGTQGLAVHLQVKRNCSFIQNKKKVLSKLFKKQVKIYTFSNNREKFSV